MRLFCHLFSFFITQFSWVIFHVLGAALALLYSYYCIASLYFRVVPPFLYFLFSPCVSRHVSFSRYYSLQWPCTDIFLRSDSCNLFSLRFLLLSLCSSLSPSPFVFFTPFTLSFFLSPICSGACAFSCCCSSLFSLGRSQGQFHPFWTSR